MPDSDKPSEGEVMELQEPPKSDNARLIQDYLEREMRKATGLFDRYLIDHGEAVGEGDKAGAGTGFPFP